MQSIIKLLGKNAEYLLAHKCAVKKEELTLPGPDYIDRVWLSSDRNINVIRSLQILYGNGNLAGTGYLSILPVDQGVEHTAGASFSPNPIYFNPENIVKLAIEAGCNGVASTLGTLGMTARKYAHKIPHILKINHNELLTYPNKHDQVLFASVKQAWDMGAVAVGATIYFGSAESNRQIQEISDAFARAHELGMATILWCYLRNSAFSTSENDFHAAADLTGQANYLGVTIGADIIKQKLPENNGGFVSLKFGKFSEAMYDKLASNHPIDLTRYQVLNCYAGKIALINSGGASGDNDLDEAIFTAVVNKRAGGSGLILGRKAFQKSFAEGVELIKAVQAVYLDKDITIA